MLLTTKGLSVLRTNAKPIILPDLTLTEDDHILLLGPSGSGKTTFLSVISGLLKPTTGAVHINDVDIGGVSHEDCDALRARTFGFIFQNLHLLNNLSLLQNVVLASSMAKVNLDEAYLNTLLQRLGLNDKLHRKPHELSTGEQQRTAIARALINKPKILIADEPTSALDDENAFTVIDLLQTHARESHAALIIATHDKRIMDKFDRIVALDHTNEMASS